MRRSGCIVFLPGHVRGCPGIPEVIGQWTYYGYGVVRVFEVRFCPVCGFVDDHQLVTERQRTEPINRDLVVREQRAERARKDTLIAAARAGLPVLEERGDNGDGR